MGWISFFLPFVPFPVSPVSVVDGMGRDWGDWMGGRMGVLVEWVEVEVEGKGRWGATCP